MVTITTAAALARSGASRPRRGKPAALTRGMTGRIRYRPTHRSLAGWSQPLHHAPDESRRRVASRRGSAYSWTSCQLISQDSWTPTPAYWYAYIEYQRVSYPARGRMIDHISTQAARPAIATASPRRSQCLWRLRTAAMPVAAPPEASALSVTRQTQRCSC